MSIIGEIISDKIDNNIKDGIDVINDINNIKVNNKNKILDTVIIGKGPAGITAALYLKRANMHVVVIGKESKALQKTKHIQNYYGFPDGISGDELYNRGISQAKNLGIEILDDEVLDIVFESNRFTKENDNDLNNNSNMYLSKDPASKDSVSKDSGKLLNKNSNIIKNSNNMNVDKELNSSLNNTKHTTSYYKIVTSKAEYFARTIVLATGKNRRGINVPGVKEYEGHGISYCAICDAFFFRNKDVAVVGNGNYALHEANVLKDLAKSVTILTNGKDLSGKFQNEIQDDKIKNNEIQNNEKQNNGIQNDRKDESDKIQNKEINKINGKINADNKLNRLESNFRIIKDKIKSFEGQKDEKNNIHLNNVVFEDGKSINVSGVFIAEGIATNDVFSKKLGILMKDNNIVVNSHGETNVKGIFAAGDCTSGLLQICKATYEGANVAMAIIQEIKNLNN